jgi:hypothetical protein
MAYQQDRACVGYLKPQLLPNDTNERHEQIAIATAKELVYSTTNSGCGAGALFQSRIPQCDHGRSGGGVGDQQENALRLFPWEV